MGLMGSIRCTSLTDCLGRVGLGSRGEVESSRASVSRTFCIVDSKYLDSYMLDQVILSRRLGDLL